MRQRRTFTKEFKKQVVEEILSGVSKPSQLARRYTIDHAVLARWQRAYAKGGLNHEPASTSEAALCGKIEHLEGMVGRLTMENEALKKALSQALSHERQKGPSLPKTLRPLEVSDKDARC